MGNGIYRLGWGVAAVFALLFAASMSGIVQGGALDPPGAPGSTMKSLDDVPPAWNQMLSATGGCTSARFDCVLGSDVAVLDRETGLVWERVPDVTQINWVTALEGCSAVFLGGRIGWRLPTIEELYSLFDTSADGMPTGHPFTELDVSYWASTTDVDAPTSAYIVRPSTANSGSVANALKTAALPRRWCVRGGEGIDGQ